MINQFKLPAQRVASKPGHSAMIDPDANVASGMKKKWVASSYEEDHEPEEEFSEPEEINNDFESEHDFKGKKIKGGKNQ